MNYSLELRNPYFYKKKIPISLLHFTAGFLLLLTWNLSSIETMMPVIGTILLIIALFELIYTFFAFKMMHRSPRLNSGVRMVTAIAFLFYAGFLFYLEDSSFSIFMLVIGLIFIFIFFVEKKWAKPFIIHLQSKGVLFPGTFKAPLIPWENFNNVVLKDNILTLDLVSNKVMQLEMRVIEDQKKVAEINSFCKQCIKEQRKSN